jgi:single-stranded-DNA-specific exonuclease
VALAETAGIDLSKCSERDVSFGLAPRLNAAGRLAEPDIASELLLAETLEAVGDRAQELNRLNTERRAIQERVFQEAEESLQPFIGEDTNFLLAVGTGWHGGVVGIVASKLSEKYGVPAAVLTIGEDGIARGSGRSPEWFHLCEALGFCAKYLEGYGGHSCAAGLSVHLDNLDVLREELNRVASEMMADLDIQPGIEIEAELPLGAIDQEVAETVEALGPFGPLNPEPLLLATSVEVKSAQPTADGVHLRLMLAEGSRVIPGIAFGLAQDLADFGSGDVVDVCYNLNVNRFNGGESPQMIVRDLRRADWKAALTSPKKTTARI